MLRTNADRLVKISVVGEISSPMASYPPYRITPKGEPVVLPSMGGITYNVRVGDLVNGFEADHVEPGVSVKNKEKEEFGGRYSANTALNILACIGNEAIVISGDAKGKKGTVVGKHGGIEHVLVDFKPDILEKLVVGDKILVKAVGVGLKLIDFPAVKIMNADPSLIDKMGIKVEGDKLSVPVTHTIPAAIMGSGLGATQTYSGDYDIQLFDENMNKKYGLDDLRFGDIVAIMDADHSYGRIYKEGAVSIGIIIHSACVIAGHGPGVTTLLTSRDGKIMPRIDPSANIAKILSLR